MTKRSDTFVVDLPEAGGKRGVGRITSESNMVESKASKPAKRSYTSRIAGVRIRSKSALKTTFLKERGTRRPSIFVSYRAKDFAPLAKVANEEKGNLRLLLLEEVSDSRREYLQTLFRTVVTPGGSLDLLKGEELVEVLSARNRADLFVGGLVNADEEVVVLYRGTFDRLAVPFDWFARRSDTEPDFSRFKVVDYGQTLQFGDFEAAADAVLYDFDSDYRTQAKKRQIELDESWGGSLRRLRDLKGLSRSDFPSVSAKEIARIERGEVTYPREETRKAIAKRLGVSADEIASY
jgi:hypothetical protein